MTQSGLTIASRAASRALAVCAAVLVLAITFGVAHAETTQVADIMPVQLPPDLVQVRSQPAMVAPAPGEQALTPELLANYVARQKALHDFNVDAAEPQAELTQDVLMGYIARASFGGDNGALSAIASFTTPAKPAEPALNPTFLARYIDAGFEPTAERVKKRNLALAATGAGQSESDCLAQAIYHEARGESEAGQYAVANVIVNRALSGKFPATLCGVIYQNASKGYHRCQFTFACDGKDDTPGERNAWNRSKAIAKAVYAEFATGQQMDSLPRSVLYYHTRSSNPSWSNTYTQVAQIGSHLFYAPN
ncbi:cell wall hydrolase [Devosia sp.]|uniref:cell wall hydrolase n=1 Tax=Devosia sp. TaxID=1871048 RepID=UPI002630FF05|nr:cell wall hydrolase [Devosia sp.]